MARIAKTNGTAKVSTSGRTAGKKSSALSWTSIVRNTSTSRSASVTPSYTPVIMPGRRRSACEKEKVGLQRISAVSPVVATKVSDDEYKVSLNFEALKEVIQGFDSLDLCGVEVKLCTVTGDTVFTGSVTIDDLTSANGAFDNITVNDTADITTLNVTWLSTFGDKAVFEADVDIAGMLNTNGIVNDWDLTNTGKIETEEFVATNIVADDIQTATIEVTDKATIQNADINTETVHESAIDSATIGTETVNTSTINNATIGTEHVTNSTIDEATIGVETVVSSTINSLIARDASISNATIANETVTTSTITNATITKATISEEDVAVSNISTANIETENVHTSNIEDANITNASITNADIENADIEDANIVTEKVLSSEIDNLTVNVSEHNKGNLTVDGTTDLQALEVNGEANFREKTKVYDDFEVSGNTLLNGELKVNWPETHNGDITYNGDVVFNGKVTIDDLDLDVDLNDYQKKDQKGVVNGYASLDNTGKVPMSQLPNIAGGINYKGWWNAGTGQYPASPSNGDMYYCTNGGTVGSVTYSVGDRIIFDSAALQWSRLPDNYGVQSVNGRTGIVVDVQDTTDRKDTVDLTTPLTTKYLSEKAVADLINPLIQRIEELETANTRMDVPDLSGSLPQSMVEWQSYNVTITGMTADTNIVVLNTNTNGNIVVEPHNGYITIVSSANETNPQINILTVKPSI